MTSTRPTVAVLGTGIIGAPVARNLAAAGFDVRAWNRDRAKADPLAAAGVHVAETPEEAVRGAKVVLTIVKDAPAVLDIITAAAPGLADDVVWVQSSTVGEDIDGLTTFAADHGLALVDAPVSGTRQPAEQGRLVIVAAGPERDTVDPLFDVIGKKTVWVGTEPGAASRLKLALNTLVITLATSVGEMLALAEGLGVSADHALDVIADGPLDSGFLQAKARAIRADDYAVTFSVDNAEKDARLVLAAADRLGIRLDGVAAAADRLARASAKGHGDADLAAAYLASYE
ncbi:NAD(P)-dependent oxidoreductase [Actinokineospora enzanensis]|uniref:NAD(P)-dependent oxidoreductase n=1 Tax=Actinokineospora enzanensis TaxID=155975 RepID=UPI00036CB052|nr:NAD(P)-dependent oxidoreductase [Actinokineospora enzanensis]